MTKIKGPITFKAGKEPPLFIKQYIKKNGLKTGFNINGFKYSNRKIDGWFRIRQDNKKYKFNKNNDSWEEDLEIFDEDITRISI